MGNLRWVQQPRGCFFVFVYPPLLAFVSLVFFIFFFFLGVTVLLPPQYLSLDVSVGCFVYKAGETLFRQKLELVPHTICPRVINLNLPNSRRRSASSLTDRKSVV